LGKKGLIVSKRIGFPGLALTALLFVPAVVEADYVPLPSDLGTLTKVGNYTSFGGDTTLTFTGYSSSSNNGVALAASALSVNEMDTSTSTGFTITGPLAAEMGGATGSQNDVTISYTLSTTGPGFAALGLNSNGATSGNGLAQVVEDVYTDSTEQTLLGQISSTSGPSYLIFNGTYSSLFVTKDIQYDTFDPSSSATFSIIDQTYYNPGNVPSLVPEPASFAMLGLGLGFVAIAAVRSRRKSSNAGRPLALASSDSQS
jgi:hypothetical protein